MIFDSIKDSAHYDTYGDHDIPFTEQLVLFYFRFQLAYLGLRDFAIGELHDRDDELIVDAAAFAEASKDVASSKLIN